MTKRINPFEDDNFARHCGIELLEVTEEGARSQMVIQDYHMNGYELVQGGAIFTLAVWTFAVAANAHGKMAVGINANISFVKAIREGTIYAEARLISSNQKLLTYAVEVTDEEGDIIAAFQGMAYRKR